MIRGIGRTRWANLVTCRKQPLRLPRAVATFLERPVPTQHSQFATATNPSSAKVRQQYDHLDVFKRVALPSERHRDDIKAWVAILDAGLPHHLREGDASQFAVSLDATDYAEILHAALLAVNDDGGILYHLGMVQGRWRETIWLIKHLVENFARPTTSPSGLTHNAWSQSVNMSLDDLTRNPIDLQQPEGRSEPWRSASAFGPTLRELTDNLKSTDTGRMNQGVLGHIWQSLGAMVVACADGVVKPEILEIIAYLHHQEIMPISIYSQKPTTDRTAIQQPPTLHLLSSRILMSLSDAAWRAHERVILEESKSQGGKYHALRPELPGMAYRVRVGGLRPEIWLELILWSCLHGGWIMEGASILRCVYKQNPIWRPLSWRSAIPVEKNGQPDWDKLDYVFNTRSSATVDPPDTPVLDVSRTLSSEVVNAYVDAFFSKASVGVGSQGLSPSALLRHLSRAKSFLGRSDLRLVGGSWDAVILRIQDLQAGETIHWKLLKTLATLAPTFGHEVEPATLRSLPDYVSDGSAAFVGLCHRVLHENIKHGYVESAIRVFRLLQEYTDTNKRKSLEDFFLNIQSDHTEDQNTGTAETFDSNYPTISYPAFDLQIPATTLGPFMNMLTDAGAHNLGKWLLYSDEVDGPVIPERLYNDPAIAPALVNFATKTDDRVLLSKLIDLRAQTPDANGSSTLPSNVIRSFLQTQFRLRRWSAATRILEYMNDMPGLTWDVNDLAALIREMLLLQHSSIAGDKEREHDLRCAKDIFSSMVRGSFSASLQDPQVSSAQITVLLTVFSAVEEQWAVFCFLGRHVTNFNLTAASFNLVLQGVLEAHGSAAAKQLLTKFWPRAFRNVTAGRRRLASGQLGAPGGVRFRRKPLDNPDKNRNEIELPGGQRVVIYGGLRPNLTTISMILRKALDEMKLDRAQSDGRGGSSPDTGDVATAVGHSQAVTGTILSENYTAPSSVVTSCVRYLQALGMSNRDIRHELEEEYGLQQRLPKLFESLQGEDE